MKIFKNLFLNCISPWRQGKYASCTRVADKFSNDNRMVKKIIGPVFIIIQILSSGCNKETTKIEYGSNGGRQLSILDTKIYYEEYGQGTPLLLLSGGGLGRSINDFKDCIPDLASHYRVIAPDTPGQGRSEQLDTLNYEVLLEFASRLIDSLEIDSAYVMGWSDGGIVGILLAEKRPDKIKKVIAVGANNGLRRAIPPGIPIDSVYPMSIDLWEKNNKELIEQYMNTLPRDWKKQVNSLNRMWYQREAYFSDSIYGRINIPVMIVLGDRDDIVAEHGLEMHRLIKGSQLCILPNTTHEVFSKKPDLIDKIAIDFFND